jgi:hypothetical protein
MSAQNFSIARKPVVQNFSLRASIAEADKTLKEVGKAWQKHYYKKQELGFHFENPELSNAFEKHCAAVVIASNAMLRAPSAPTLATHLEAIGTRLGLGARGVAKGIIGITAGAILMALHIGTLGATAWSSRVNTGSRYILLHGCLRGAGSDIARMFYSGSEGLLAKYEHAARSEQYKGKLKGSYSPIFSGVRSPV